MSSSNGKGVPANILGSLGSDYDPFDILGTKSLRILKKNPNIYTVIYVFEMFVNRDWLLRDILFFNNQSSIID